MRVPTYDLQEVAPTVGFQQGVDVRADADAFGAGIGSGMQSIGKGLGQVSEALGAVKDFDARLKAKDNLTAMQRDLMDLQYGENGYLTTSGKTAVDGQKEYLAKLEELRRKYSADLDPAAAQHFNDAADSVVLSSTREGIVHAAQGRKDWNAESASARLALYSDQALRSFAKPDDVNKNIAAGILEIRNQAHDNGWDATVVADKERTFTSKVYSAVALAMAQQSGGASKALDYLNANSDKIEAGTLLDIQKSLKPFVVEEKANATVAQIIGAGRTRDTATDHPSGLTGSKAFLSDRSVHKDRPMDTAGLDDAFADNLHAMIQDAPPEVRDGLQIGSAFRTPDEQASIVSSKMGSYGFSAAERAAWAADVASMGAEAAGAKWRPRLQASGLTRTVGVPGGSNHQHGKAVDLNWNGQRLDKAPPYIQEWVHKNAEKYGMRFPMSYEGWHIEPSNARSGGMQGSTVVATRNAPSARAGMPSYDEAMAKAMAIEDPAEREAVFKQLNQMFEISAKAEQEAQREAKRDIFSQLMQGARLQDIPIETQIAAGEDAISGFRAFEDQSQQINTDPIMYSNLTRMAAQDPDGFSKIDLTAPEIINALSRSDLKGFMDTQANVLAEPRKAREEGLNISQAMGWASTQLESVGISTARGSDDQKEAAARQQAEFQMMLLQEMKELQKKNNGLKPTQEDVMKITNRLLLPIAIKEERSTLNPKSWFGSNFSTEEGHYLFEANKLQDGQTFEVVAKITDIPVEFRAAIRRDLTLELGHPPSDDEVISRYEEVTMSTK